MGNNHSQSHSHKSNSRSSGRKTGFAAIKDKYHSLGEVQAALRSVGLESSNLVIGVDFTKSNTWNGKVSNHGRCLHDLTPGGFNPYQKVIDIMGRTLEVFDEDKLFPTFGFGDLSTKDTAVFSFNPDGSPCFGLAEVLSRYTEVVRRVQLSGPTSFAPIIRKTIEIVQETRQYHILVILTDGAVDDVTATASAIVDASNYPISIIAIGIGDADFTVMHQFDDELPERNFDNYQFVEFSKVTSPTTENFDVAFALAALQEIPEQWAAIKELRLLR